jgi:hypothetical protein
MRLRTAGVCGLGLEGKWPRNRSIASPVSFSIMNALLKITGKFLLTLAVMTLLCTLAWQQFVTDTLYHCTDPGWLDFLSPGQWIHNPVPVAHVNG